LTSEVLGGEWSASLPGRFIPGEIAPGTDLIGGIFGLRAAMDEVKKNEF
jgi:hypothetical protein